MRSNFKFTLLTGCEFPARLKFNRKVEILKRQNLDFAWHRSAFKFKINSTAAQCGKNSSAENSAVQVAQNEAATARGSVTGAKTAEDIVNSDAVSERSAKRMPPRAVLLCRQNDQRGSDIAPWRAEHGAEWHRVLARKYCCGSGAAMRRAFVCEP